MRPKHEHALPKAALLAVYISLVILFLCTKPAYAAQGTKDTSEKYAETLERLSDITDEYTELASMQNETLNELQGMRSKVADIESKIDSTKEDVAQKQAELEEKQASLSKRISNNYKAGSVSLLSILFSATSFEDAISKFHYYQVVCNAEVEQIEDVKESRAELQKRQDDLEKLYTQLNKQEASLTELYENHQQQADDMYAQQLEVAELLSSIPKEDQKLLGDDAEELVGISEMVVEAEKAKDTSKQDEEDASKEDEKAADEDIKESDDNADTSSKTDEQADEDETHNDQAESSQTTSDQDSESTADSNESSSDTTEQTSSDSNIEETPSEEITESESESQSNPALQRLINTAYATGPTRRDWGCSGWVYTVFQNAGISSFSGSAASFCNTWCFSSDRSELKPGMIIAVTKSWYTGPGAIYGHIGIYLGENTVRHFTEGQVQDMTVDGWIAQFGSIVAPRWGWNGGVVLS